MPYQLEVDSKSILLNSYGLPYIIIFHLLFSVGRSLSLLPVNYSLLLH